MGVIDILVLFEQASKVLTVWWEYAKEEIRKYIGPSPHIKYLVFENDEVIPEGREHCKYAHVAQYIPHECRISAKNTEASYKRLPWISLRHCIGDHVIDLSDWMSDIRTNTPISLLSLLRVYSYTLNEHLPETDHAKVLAITRDGEEDEYKYTGKTKLLRRIEPVPVMRHCLTLPYDSLEPEGGLFF